MPGSARVWSLLAVDYRCLDDVFPECGESNGVIQNFDIDSWGALYGDEMVTEVPK